jgi:hypothetical protein
MSFVRTIQISALNVAMHNPHSTEKYVALLKDANRDKKLVRFSGFNAAMIGSLSVPKDLQKNKFLTGEIFRFVNIDHELPWFNTLTSEEATDGDMEKVKIPEHLLPNFQRIEFVFNPFKHQLWIITQDRKESMGITRVAKFFQDVFDQLVNERRYPVIEVTPIPDQDKLETILANKSIEKIKIDLRRPNPDDDEDIQIKWQKKLEKLNAKQIRVEINSVEGEWLVPDEDTKEMARIAANNGNVSVYARDEHGLPYQESTQEKPLSIHRHVNSEMETSMDVLKRVAIEHQGGVNV